MAATTRWSRLSFGALIALSATVAWAQQPSGDESPATKKETETTRERVAEKSSPRLSTEISPPPLPSAAGSSTLVLIVDAEPEVDQNAVQERVRRAAEFALKHKGQLREGESFPEARVLVEPLKRETFDTLARFILDGRLPGSGSDPKDAGLERDRDAWTLKLGGPYVLDELIVDYASGRGETAPKPRSFKPSDPGVSRTSLGVYQIEGIAKENGPSPIGYTIKRTDGLKALEPLRLLWPKENSYWQVTIEKMGENQAELFEKLADENLFANPLVKKQVSERKLALGSMLKVKVETDVTFVGNTVTFRFFKPPKTSPTRVWMKFPVWPDEVKDQLARYKSSNEFRLPEKIESETPLLAGGSEAKLSPRSRGSSADARWYEILAGPDGQVFERRFDIDAQHWAKDLEGPPVRLLIVWQKDDGKGGNKQAYEFNDPVTRDSYRVKSEEVAGWAVGVKSADSKH